MYEDCLKCHHVSSHMFCYNNNFTPPKGRLQIISCSANAELYEIINHPYWDVTASRDLKR